MTLKAWVRIVMSNQAMGIEPNFESDSRIVELQVVIPKIEAELATSRVREELMNTKVFKDIVIDGLLDAEANVTASELVGAYSVGAEREQEILFELRALRYLKLLLISKANEVETLKTRLAENKQLLLELMTGREDT